MLVHQRVSILNQPANVGMTDQPFSKLRTLPCHFSGNYSKLSGIIHSNIWLIEIPTKISNAYPFFIIFLYLLYWNPLNLLLKSHEKPGKIPWNPLEPWENPRKVAEHEDCLPVPQRGVPGPLCPWGRITVNPPQPGVDPSQGPSLSYTNAWVNYSYT